MVDDSLSRTGASLLIDALQKMVLTTYTELWESQLQI